MTHCQSTIVSPVLIPSFAHLPLQRYQINCPYVKNNSQKGTGKCTPFEKHFSPASFTKMKKRPLDEFLLECLLSDLLSEIPSALPAWRGIAGALSLGKHEDFPLPLCRFVLILLYKMLCVQIHLSASAAALCAVPNVPITMASRRFLIRSL